MPERCCNGFQRWKVPLEGSAGRGSSAGRGQGCSQGFPQVLYDPFHLHSVLFQAIVDVWPQLVQRDESVAEPHARGDSATSVVDSVSVAWQAREVVTWPMSAAAKPGAVAELMFQSGQTPWYKVLELNVATASGMKVVCMFPVRVKGLQGKKRAEYMFGVGKRLHRSWSYQMYHQEDGQSVWYGLWGLQVVGGDEVPESVMKVFAAWVNERKESYVGGRGHTRGAAIEVEGDDDDAEDKEQPKDKDKDKGKDKAKDEPKEKGNDKGQRKDKDKDKDKAQTTRASESSQSQSEQSEQSQQMVDVRAMADEVV